MIKLSDVVKVFFYLFYCLLIVSCTPKKSNQDSNSDADSISIYIDKAFDFSLTDKEVFETTNKAYELLKKQKQDSTYIKNNFYVAFSYDNIGKSDLFKKINLEMVETATKLNDSLNLARAYTYLGEYYTKSFSMDSAVIYFHQAEKIYLRLNDNLGAGKANLKMAIAKYNERDYIGSENSAIKALIYLRLEKNSALLFDAYSILGLTSIGIRDFEKSEEYFEKSLEIASKNNLSEYGQVQSKAIALSNLGLVNLKADKYERSLIFLNQALNEPNLREEHLSLYASLLNLKGKSNLALNNLKLVSSDFYESLQIREQLNLVPSIVESQLSLAEYYDKVNQKDSALKYANDAYKIAKETRILNLQLEAVDVLTKVDTENVNTHSKEHIKLSDSLLQAERKVSEKFARIEYETDEFKRQKEQLAVQNRNIILFALLAVFIIILLYIIRDQRSRNKFFRLREQQQRANEEIYSLMLSQQRKLDEVVLKEKQRIGQELHDGVLGRLFGARLNLDSLNKNNDELAIAGRNHYISELKFIEQDIREISHELSREKFALINNFVAILTNLFEEQKNLSEELELKYTIDQAIKWDKVDNDLKINLYRIIQESLQNINKYAKAKNVSVNLLKDAEHLHVTIIDDGIGFDVTKKSKGIGLQNITSRVETCKGTFDIKSKPGKGTTITIDLPFIK